VSSANRVLEPVEETAGATGGIACLEFANTVHDYGAAGDPRDDIDSYATLLAWAQSRGVIDHARRRKLSAAASRDPRAAEAAMARARALREAIYRILSARARAECARSADVDRLNAALGHALAGAALASSGSEFRWRWAEGEGLAAPILWPVARSAAELLTSEKSPRIVECGGKTCTWLIMDATKNHSRKFCSAEGCGNRTRVRRHYERQRARN